MDDLEIIKLGSPESLEEVEKLQAVVWSGSPIDIVPVHVLLAAIHNGGLVLGAYKHEMLAGMLFGFPGIYSTREGMRFKHCSHILGVHPDMRNTGVGFKLKIAQRQFVLGQGLNLITWTYDPLLSRNASLNIHKLGGTCDTYLRSEYGMMRDGLNSGLDSDRFQVDWWLESCQVRKSLDIGHDSKIHLDEYTGMGVEILPAVGEVQPPSGHPNLTHPLFMVEIPSDFQTIKAKDLSLAKEWRMVTREIFEKAFINGYHVIDFLFDQGRSFYILEIQ
jgi:predicted GNAT superfamily acetyltransferase